jgi:hypothetical protein
MKKYSVSAFNHCNKFILNEHTIFANDFWDANDKVDTILKESGYDILYISVSIREVERT